MSTRIIFMGTPTFAVPILQRLIQENYDIVAVYTQPPKPSGRGYHVQKTPIHEIADLHRIPVHHPKSLRNEEAQQIFYSHEAVLGVVVAYGLILPKSILEAPQKGCINVHASLLPRWRGAAPIQRAIEAGDDETGICIIKMDEGLDTGPVLTKKSIPISLHTTSSQLFTSLAQLGGDLLIETLPPYLKGIIQTYPQPTEGITYAHKIEKKESLVDWEDSPQTIYNKWRAFQPWPGLFFQHKGSNIKIVEMEVGSITNNNSSGTIIALKPFLVVQCAQGSIIIKTVQKQGGKALPVQAFLNGHHMEIGEVLT